MGNPDTIGQVALTLMAEHGWANTTMSMIAQAAGVSTPTLFRYFPTKADLLWHGMDDTSRAFTEQFAATPDSAKPGEAVADAYLAMLQADPDRLHLIQARVAIIGRDPDAAEASWPKFEEWRVLVTTMLAQRIEPSADRVRVRVMGAMVWAALWSAVTAWAVTDEPDPGPFVRIARDHIAALR